MKDEKEETIDPEIETSLPVKVETVLHPILKSVEELATAGEEALEIIKIQERILAMLRLASLRLTSPQDWLLFKASAPGQPDRITAYLEDQGCRRIADIWGIEVTPPNGMGDFPFDKIPVENEFAYRVRGDAFCHKTGRRLYGVEGLRGSTDDFIVKANPPLSPLMKDMRVRQAARANLNGNCIRSLTGLDSVAVEEIETAWQGTKKNTAMCPRGKGFGKKTERQIEEQAQEKASGAEIKPPICETCGKAMIFRPGGQKSDGSAYAAYWKCPDYVKGGQHSAINDNQYRKSTGQNAND